MVSAHLSPLMCGGKDESIQRRLRAMERTLRKVESLPENEVTKLLEMDNDESLD